MRAKLKKKHIKGLDLYFKYFSTNKKLNLIMDFTVVRESSIVRYDVVEGIAKNYNLEVELYTTSCLLEECRRFGEIMEKSYDVMKNYQIVKCNHKYTSSKKCLQIYLSLWSGIYDQQVGEKDKCHINDGKNWAVASNCTELGAFMITVPGIIWFGFKFNLITLRKVTKATKSYIDEYEKKKEQGLIKSLEEKVEKIENKKGKMKKAQKPNPLSVKKPTKKSVFVKKRRMNDGWKNVINEIRSQKGLPYRTDFPDYIYFSDNNGYEFIGTDLINS